MNFLIASEDRGYLPIKDLVDVYCKSLELLGLPSRLIKKREQNARYLCIVMKVMLGKMDSLEGSREL